MKNNNKIIHYDKEEDILAFYLKRGAEEEFKELAPGIVVEFGKDRSVIGIEILNASRTLKPFLKGVSKRVPSYAR